MKSIGGTDKEPAISVLTWQAPALTYWVCSILERPINETSNSDRIWGFYTFARPNDRQGRLTTFSKPTQGWAVMWMKITYLVTVVESPRDRRPLHKHALPAEARPSLKIFSRIVLGVFLITTP